jgi:hypothetical protein
MMTLPACQSQKYMDEKQITYDLSYNHDLDNNDNFSPDDQWLVYDTRTEAGGIGANAKVEKVNIHTGEKVVLYELTQNKDFGPGVGAVSYSHNENKVVFIHGLMSVTVENPYQQWRRTGVIIDDKNPGVPIFMDARSITFPYTPGALRGGTHRHEWSGDGKWIGYTYNDAIMKQLEDETGDVYNLRTIGVSKNIGAVHVPQDAEGENFSGEWFSVLVVRVVANPAPASDEISRAAGDSWVGLNGYTRTDGSMQIARAFIGTVKNSRGKDVDEVFIVDIPDDITVPGKYGPLEGTDTAMPAPPAGTHQRRLTHTADSSYPACMGIVRSTPDGSRLAYRASDAQGIMQIFTVSPYGGKPVQHTFHTTDVQSGVRWFPDGKRMCYIWNNSIIVKETGTKDFTVLTEPTEIPPADVVVSHDGRTVAFNRPVDDASGNRTKQIFIIRL